MNMPTPHKLPSKLCKVITNLWCISQRWGFPGWGAGAARSAEPLRPAGHDPLAEPGIRTGASTDSHRTQEPESLGRGQHVLGVDVGERARDRRLPRIHGGRGPEIAASLRPIPQ